MLARFSGQCADCGDDIAVGEEIRGSGQGSGLKYRHETCPQGKSKPSHIEREVRSQGYQRKAPKVEWSEDGEGNVTRIVIDWERS